MNWHCTQRTKLSIYTSGLALNIWNLHCSIKFENVWISILSLLCMAWFIYMLVEVIIKGYIKKPATPKRIPCTYPMSEFYNFENEVPDGTRVSTVEDCLGCNDMDCANSDAKYCLIGEMI